MNVEHTCEGNEADDACCWLEVNLRWFLTQCNVAMSCERVAEVLHTVLSARAK